jgi:hypothetical protein
MDFLFAKNRTAFVFLDKSATQIGAIFDRDMTNGEALTAFDSAKVLDTEQGVHLEHAS